MQRRALALTSHAAENNTGLYLLRLLGFVMILAAIIDTNRGGARSN